MERTGLGIAAAEPDAESTRDNCDTYECDCTKSPHPTDSPIGKKSRACGFDFHEPSSHAEGTEHQWWYRPAVAALLNVSCPDFFGLKSSIGPYPIHFDWHRKEKLLG